MRTAAVRCRIRPMTAADIPQVMEIERESFPSMWPQTAYRRELQNRLARYYTAVDPSTILEPAEETRPSFRSAFDRLLHREPEPPTRELVLGFAGMWLMVDEAHVVTLAVRESYRRHGIGEWLLITCVEQAQESMQEGVTLEVRRSNDGARLLYEKYGFEAVGIRRRYYSDNGEDAILMTVSGIQSQEYRLVLDGLKAEHQRRWGYD